MESKDTWYGFLEAGDKSSPVVIDASIDAGDNKIYLYNYVRDQFIEYAKAIVEPKLRDLAEGDTPRDQLDTAFKAARRAFSSKHKSPSWTVAQPSADKSIKSKEDDTDEYDMADDDDIEDFIDDD